MPSISFTYLLQKHCEGDLECEKFVREQGEHLMIIGHDADPLTDPLFVIQCVSLYKKFHKNNNNNKD